MSTRLTKKDLQHNIKQISDIRQHRGVLNVTVILDIEMLERLIKSDAVTYIKSEPLGGWLNIDVSAYDKPVIRPMRGVNTYFVLSRPPFQLFAFADALEDLITMRQVQKTVDRISKKMITS